METTLMLWSAASEETRTDVGGGGGNGVYVPNPGNAVLLREAPGGPDVEPCRQQLQLQQPLAPSSRPSKKKKPPAGPKRPPQRGLGVEKLERLRLQERWRKMTEIEPPQQGGQQVLTVAGAGQLHGHQPQQLLLHYGMEGQCQPPHSPFGLYNGFPLYDHAGVSGRMSSLPRSSMVGAPAALGHGGAWGTEACVLQQYGVLGTGLVESSETLSATRSAVFTEHAAGSALFRVATSEASFTIGKKPSELPSTQSFLQCSEECDICIKKRMPEEKLTYGGAKRSGEGKRPLCLFGTSDRKADACDEGGKTTEMEYNTAVPLKEHEFFPCSTSTATSNSTFGFGGALSGSEENHTTGDDARSFSSASARSAIQLDLTLKLSF